MMSMHLTFLQLFLLSLLVTTTFCETLKPSRHDLENYLLKEKDYDKNFPPNKENATDVSVQLYITDFNKESAKEREIEFTLNLRMNWTDHRLDFTKNETTFDVIPFGDHVVKSIWIPDLYFLQERKSLLHGLLKDNQLVYIFKNGSVFYSGRFNIKSHCVMTFEKYPYDTQKCSIEIQSYALTTDYIHLHWNGNKAVKLEPSTDPFKVEISSQEKSTETQYVYQEIGVFSALKTEIVVPRHRGSYFIVVIMCPAILVLLSMSSFGLSYKMETRITTVSKSLTSLFVHWGAIYKNVSLDSTLDYIDSWITLHLVTLVVILIANILICHFKDRLSKDLESKNQNASKSNTSETETEFGAGQHETSRQVPSGNTGRKSENKFKQCCKVFEFARTFAGAALIYLVIVLAFILGGWKE